MENGHPTSYCCEKPTIERGGLSVVPPRLLSLLSVPRARPGRFCRGMEACAFSVDALFPEGSCKLVKKVARGTYKPGCSILLV